MASNYRCRFGEIDLLAEARPELPDAVRAALQTAVTDARGFAGLSLVASTEVVIVVPLLGQDRALRPRPGTIVNDTWVILLPAGRQPSLIP